MLAKPRRLPRAVFDTRPLRRVSFKYGTVAFFAHKPVAAAVVVSKKVAKTAVVRNALRRRTYHALRALVPHLTHSVVVYPKADAARALYAEYAALLAEALHSR